MRRSIIAGALVLPLMLHAAGFWWNVIREASNPFQHDYGEGIVLYQASKITDPNVAYKPISTYPYVVFHYPPLYHLVVLAFSKVAGSLLRAGRAVSVMSVALIEVTIAFLVYMSLPGRFGLWRRLGPALLAGLLPTLLVVMKWTPLARVDMLAVLLSFAGLGLFVLARRTPIWQYVAFVLLVAAAFTKQTAIAASIACLLAALIVDPKQALRLMGFATGLGGVVLGALWWWTRGEVIRHLFLYNQNTFSVDRMISTLGENLLLVSPIGALAVVYLVLIGDDLSRVPAGRRRRRLRAWLTGSRLRRLGLVGAFMLVAAFGVSLTCGKAGSSYNYFIEWNLVCCLLAGLVVHRCWSMPWCKALVLFAAVGLPIVILGFRLPMGIRGLLPRSTAAQALEEVRIETHADLTKLIRDARGPVFSEEMLLLVEAGKDVPAEPAILRELATTGLWDERLFTRLIDGQRFEFLVIENLYDHSRYTPAVVAAIEAAYAETRKVLHLEIYEPRVSKSP